MPRWPRRWCGSVRRRRPRRSLAQCSVNWWWKRRNDMGLFDTINTAGAQALGLARPTGWGVGRVLAVAGGVLLFVAHLLLWGRQLVRWVSVRLRPHRVGPAGPLPP